MSWPRFVPAASWAVNWNAALTAMQAAGLKMEAITEPFEQAESALLGKMCAAHPRAVLVQCAVTARKLVLCWNPDASKDLRRKVRAATAARQGNNGAAYEVSGLVRSGGRRVKSKAKGGAA